MRRFLFPLATIVLCLATGCAAPQPAADQPAASPEPEYKPTATIKDIMDSMVDPSADFVWESVATIVSLQGVDERRPRTDDEWKEVRRRAVTLVEATNLLLMPNRHVARAGEKSENPNIELEPEQIETMLNQDRATWTTLVGGLHDKAMITLDAIDKKDADALLMSGDALDQACERCHLKYWYPGDSEAARIFAEREKADAEDAAAAAAKAQTK